MWLFFFEGPLCGYLVNINFCIIICVSIYTLSIEVCYVYDFVFHFKLYLLCKESKKNT